MMFADSELYKSHIGYIKAFESLLAKSKYREDVCVGSPNNADLILVLDSHLMPRRRFECCLNNNPIIRENIDRVFIYDETDNPASSYRGLFVSMPKQLFDPKRHGSSIYWGIKANYGLCTTHRTKLIGFRGDCTTHAVRMKIKELETTNFYDTSEVNTNRISHDEFIELLSTHAFYLCPRGHGTASIRMFECMSVATVPVVISDDYVIPEGLVNGQNCLIVSESERDFSMIERADNVAMAREALHTYSCHWSEETRWDTYVKNLERINDSRPVMRSQYIKSVVYYKIVKISQVRLLR